MCWNWSPSLLWYILMKTTLLLFLRWLPTLALSLRQLLPVSIIEDRGGRRGGGGRVHTLFPDGPLDKHLSAETAICAGASPQRGDPGILSSYLTVCPPSQTAVWPKQDSLLPSHRSHLLTSIKSIIFKWSLPFREHRHTVTSRLSPSPKELFFRGLTCHFSCWHMSVFLLPLSDILSESRQNTLLPPYITKVCASLCTIHW